MFTLMVHLSKNIDVPMESERHGTLVLPSTLNNGTRSLN
jgi:hypothetical protein